jgi:hypothetical protein
VKRTSFFLAFALTAAVAAAQQTTPPTPQLPQPAAQQPPVAPQPTQMAQTVPAAPTPTSAMQVTNENRTMMLALLERIEKVTGDQMKEDSKSGKLSVDRSDLDEILANVSQIKTMLQK